MRVSGPAGPTGPRTDVAPGKATHPPVELVLSVKDDLLVLARLAVATVAARAGFDIEEIEDLRLAVDELCLYVLHGRHAGRLHIAFATDPGRVDVWCQFEGPEAAPANDLQVDRSENLSARILEALVDEHGPSTRDGLAGAFLTKRRPLADG